MEQPHISFARC